MFKSSLLLLPGLPDPSLPDEPEAVPPGYPDLPPQHCQLWPGVSMEGWLQYTHKSRKYFPINISTHIYINAHRSQTPSTDLLIQQINLNQTICHFHISCFLLSYQIYLHLTFITKYINSPRSVFIKQPDPVQFVSNLFLPGGFELAHYSDSKVRDEKHFLSVMELEYLVVWCGDFYWGLQLPFCGHAV